MVRDAAADDVDAATWPGWAAVPGRLALSITMGFFFVFVVEIKPNFI